MDKLSLVDAMKDLDISLESKESSPTKDWLSKTIQWLLNASRDSTTSTNQSFVSSLLMNVMTKRPDLMDSDVTDIFIDYWSKTGAPLTDLVSVDVLKKINSCSQKHASWLKYETILSKLLNRKIVTPSNMEDVILPLLKETFDDDLRKSFASCLKSVVETFKNDEDNMKSAELDDLRFLEIMDWISWIFSEEEFEDQLYS